MHALRLCHPRRTTALCPSLQAVPGGGDFGVAAEKIGSGPGALALRFMLTVHV